MKGEWRRSRAIRGTALGLANGVSLVFLAVLATAYGSQTTLQFTSVEAFLTVATAWVSRPEGAGSVWALGYLGAFVILMSPIWFFVVRPRLGDGFGSISHGETTGTRDDGQAEVGPDEAADADRSDEMEKTESVEHDRTESDEEMDFVWGDTSKEEGEGEEKKERTPAPDDETGFVWDGTSEN